MRKLKQIYTHTRANLAYEWEVDTAYDTTDKYVIDCYLSDVGTRIDAAHHTRDTAFNYELSDYVILAVEPLPENAKFMPEKERHAYLKGILSDTLEIFPPDRIERIFEECGGRLMNEPNIFTL